MKKSILSVLVVLFAATVSTSVDAVNVKITLLDENFQTVAGPFPRGSTTDTVVDLGGDYPAGCSFVSSPCISIDPGSQARFLDDGQNLGQLLLSPFNVTNFGDSNVVVRVEYDHTHKAANANKAQCAAVGMDGFTFPADGIGQDDFVSLSMSVQWKPCTGNNCGPFKIGAGGSVPCPDSLGVSSLPSEPECGVNVPCLFHRIADNMFYFPPSPPTAVNLLPPACNNCDPNNGSSSDVSAVLSKTYQARLAPFDYNNMVGTGLGLIQACGDPKKAANRKNPQCTEATALRDGIVAVIEEFGIHVDMAIVNSNPLKDGVMQIDVFSNPDFDCKTLTNFSNLSALAQLTQDGAAVKSIRNDTPQVGTCRLQFDVTEMESFTCNTTYITLVEDGDANPLKPISVAPIVPNACS